MNTVIMWIIHHSIDLHENVMCIAGIYHLKAWLCGILNVQQLITDRLEETHLTLLGWLYSESRKHITILPVRFNQHDVHLQVRFQPVGLKPTLSFCSELRPWGFTMLSCSQQQSPATFTWMLPIHPTSNILPKNRLLYPWNRSIHVLVFCPIKGCLKCFWCFASGFIVGRRVSGVCT